MFFDDLNRMRVVAAIKVQAAADVILTVEKVQVISRHGCNPQQGDIAVNSSRF